MSNAQHRPRWILYSPSAPSVEADWRHSESVKPQNAEIATSAWHEEGFFLPGADLEGWRFGLLHERLHASGLQAFVRSPLGIEATLVSDPNAQGIERLPVPPEPPDYAGAFRVQLPLPLSSLESVVSGLKAALPLIKQQLQEGGPSHAYGAA
jgi:hypothetical protein